MDGDLSQGVLAELHSRAWPGNARELRNAIEHAAIVARGRPIRPEHLPQASTGTPAVGTPDARGFEDEVIRWAGRESLDGGAGPGEPRLYERFLEIVEPPFLRTVLERCRGNRATASQALGIHRATLRQKLRKYGIE